MPEEGLMLRTNTAADVANTGRVKIDAGEGVTLDVPVVASDAVGAVTDSDVTTGYDAYMAEMGA